MTAFEWTKLLLVDVLVPIAWPLLIAIVLRIFRTEIRDALEGLTRLKLPGGVDIEFKTLSDPGTVDKPPDPRLADDASAKP